MPTLSYKVRIFDIQNWPFPDGGTVALLFVCLLLLLIGSDDCVLCWCIFCPFQKALFRGKFMAKPWHLWKKGTNTKYYRRLKWYKRTTYRPWVVSESFSKTNKYILWHNNRSIQIYIETTSLEIHQDIDMFTKNNKIWIITKTIQTYIFLINKKTCCKFSRDLICLVDLLSKLSTWSQV